jgi:hypothetical protein
VKKLFDGTPQTFYMRSLPYTIGIYYRTISNNHKKFNFSFTITGKYCTNAAGDNCEHKINELPNNTTTVIDAGMTYYSYQMNKVPESGVLQSLVLSLGLNQTNVTIWARASSIPTMDDYTSQNALTLYSPAYYTWIFALKSDNQTTITPQASLTLCPLGTAGDSCKLNINYLTDDKKYNSTKLAKPKDVYVYGLKNVSFNKLWISLADNQSPRANFYAAYNRVPVPIAGKITGYDFQACNQQYCDKVQSIKSFDNSLTDIDMQNGTWYITVEAGRKDDDFVFYYDSVCPSSCVSPVGTCTQSGANYGQCACTPPNAGLLCTPPQSSVIEYVILIVIAVLVLVSALLGLIAWAYMRKRAQYVEVK